MKEEASLFLKLAVVALIGSIIVGIIVGVRDYIILAQFITLVLALNARKYAILWTKEHYLAKITVFAPLILILAFLLYTLYTQGGNPHCLKS